MEDLVSFVQQQLDGAWNSHDLNRALQAFDDNATVTMSPAVPGLPGMLRGKDEIRQFIENLLPGFHVESGNFKADGDRVTWFSEVSSDAFRNLGVDVVESNTSAVIRNNKVISFTPSFTPDSVSKLQAASQRMGTQGQQPGTGTRPSSR